MTTSKRSGLWAVLFALLMAVALPSLALGQGRGRGSNRDKKCSKFVNCHDASEGRVDGRGPRGDNRDDGYYGDDDYNRRGRGQNRGRNDDGVINRNDLERQAVSYGYREGYNAGRDDLRSGRGYDYQDHSSYRNADRGYRTSYGDLELYRRYFQEGFRRGYDEAYRNRTSNGSGRSRIGQVLGDILGRP